MNENFKTYETEAKILADSISDQGIRIVSFQLTFPRFILPEFSKHRKFAINAASSRAIPVDRMINQVKYNPVIPVHWGANQAGMVADNTIPDNFIDQAYNAWLDASDKAVEAAQMLQALGLHKQIVNRVLEPFSWTHLIVTSTDYSNFFRLRLAADAQPEIQHLAKQMFVAMEESQPKKTRYHLPYITLEDFEDLGELNDETFKDKYAMVSSARCARVSYNKHDGARPSLEEDLKLANRLIESKHWTCTEHQAIQAETREHQSGCLKGWIQFRHLFNHEPMDDETYDLSNWRALNGIDNI